MGGKIQDQHNISNDNEKYEVRDAILLRGTYQVLTQISGHQLTLVRIIHGALTIQSIPINYCYPQYMEEVFVCTQQ